MSFDWYALALNATRAVDPESSRSKQGFQVWALRYAIEGLIDSSDEGLGVARNVFQRVASECVRGEVSLNALTEVGRKVGRTAQVEVVIALRQCVEKEGLALASLERLGILELREQERRTFYYLSLNTDLLWDAVSTLRDEGHNSEAFILEAGLLRFESIVGPFEDDEKDEESEEAPLVAATVG